MVTGEDIVASARKLLGASYRQWHPGALLPMWLADGMGDPPSGEWLKYGPGVMCADLVTWACYDNGIWAPAGTEAWGNDYLVDTQPFDPDAPGEPGAVCLSPYAGGVGAEGHIAIYVDEHTLIQALTTTGVTDQFTDIQTYVWPECGFEIYGHIPGVDYAKRGGKEDGSRHPEAPTNQAGPAWRWLAIDRDGWGRFDGPDWSRGWFDTAWRWHEPTDVG